MLKNVKISLILFVATMMIFTSCSDDGATTSTTTDTDKTQVVNDEDVTSTTQDEKEAVTDNGTTTPDNEEVWDDEEVEDTNNNQTTLCQESFSGTISDEANFHHTFDVEKDGDVTLSLTWDGESDLDLHLFKASGEEVTRSENEGVAIDEEIDTFLQAGSYKVTVVQWDEVSADYELEIACE